MIGIEPRVAVLTFHRILPEVDPLDPGTLDQREFERQLRWLQSQLPVLPLAEACDRLFAGTLRRTVAAVSIDDGYMDNYEVARPILARLGIPATCFVATGFMNGTAMFNDRILGAVRASARPSIDLSDLGLGELPIATLADKRDALHRLVPHVKYAGLREREVLVARIEQACEAAMTEPAMMGPSELRAMLRDGWDLGGHTRNHPILRMLDDAEAAVEMRASFEDLQRVTGRAPRLFAFPNGRLNDDFDERHARMAREVGFAYAFTTMYGAARRGGDRWQVPRVSTWQQSRMRFHLRLLKEMIRR